MTNAGSRLGEWYAGGGVEFGQQKQRCYFWREATTGFYCNNTIVFAEVDKNRLYVSIQINA